MKDKIAYSSLLALSIFVNLVLAQALPLKAEPALNSTSTPAKGMVQAKLPLGQADLTQVKKLLPDLLSKDARYVILKITRTLKITDYPANIEALRTFIKALDVSPRNVRIEVTHRSSNQFNTSGGQINGQLTRPLNNRKLINNNYQNTPGVTRQVTSGSNTRLPMRSNSGHIILPNKGSLDINIINQKRLSGQLNHMFILVRSGGEGFLEIVKEIPMADFFTRYKVGNFAFNVRGPGTINQNFAAGGTFELPEFRWEKSGAQLLVRPIIQGNLITIEVMPRISAVVIANPQKLSERRLNDYLTGADQYVTYTGLKTTVTIQSGQSITIGSFPAASSEFNSYFWGSSQNSASGGGSITLKATIQ